jgi:hypothetical protein
MKTIEQLATEIAKKQTYGIFEEPVYDAVIETADFLQRFIPAIEQPPTEHQLVIAQYAEDTFAVARFENGAYLTAYPVQTQPIAYRPIFYK